MIVKWLLVGIITVTIAFFLPDNSTELWPSMNAAGIVAVLYLLALLINTFRHPFPARTRIIACAISIIVICSITVTWVIEKDQGNWQREELLKIKSIMSRGKIIDDLPNYLLKILQIFYSQTKDKNVTLGQIYQQTYPYAKVQSDVYASLHPDIYVTLHPKIYQPYVMASDTSMVYTLTVLTDSQIIIVAQDRNARGRNQLFENIYRQKGMIQEKFVLTERGVCHESEN
jgi:hypothetical protein